MLKTLRLSLLHSCLFVVLVFGLAVNTQAQTYSVIHSFSGAGDGSSPQAGLTIDGAGNLYGTTVGGGNQGPNCNSFGCGLAFKLTRQGPAWTLTPLYAFQGGSDGSLPDSGIIAGPNGALYGTTSAGGTGNNGFGFGTVFDLRPNAHSCLNAPCPWTENVLYRFLGGSDGWQPTVGNLVFDASGSMYGTTMDGGSNGCYGGDGCGAVFKLTPSNGGWIETILYSFTGGSGGAYPEGALVLDQFGNIYGTATSGGQGDCNAYVGGCGVVFQLTPSANGWTENVLYSFNGGADGGVPEGGLIFGPSGVLYGTTESGGTGNGTVFELSSSQGDWALNTIYTFPGPGIPGPAANVALGADGNLYGTTLSGPPNFPPCAGSVFKLSPVNGVWDYSLLYCFTGGSDGGQPYSPVTFDTKGNLYGTAFAGGAYGYGVAWEIVP